MEKNNVHLAQKCEILIELQGKINESQIFHQNHPSNMRSYLVFVSECNQISGRYLH